MGNESGANAASNADGALVLASGVSARNDPANETARHSVPDTVPSREFSPKPPSMKKTYTQVVKQIEALQQEAEKLRRHEIDGVVSRIREAIEHYGLTAGDLGLAPKSARGALATGQPAAKKRRKAGKARPARAVKYRDEAGHTWGGIGKRPQWLRDALAAGKTLQDFSVS